ncbi:hypothetical protein MYX65_00680 [Acidobacteria bacterium AH-259-L09]|nr:hypothetical protein [Acidobacteria bacterium AH-259-L09]
MILLATGVLGRLGGALFQTVQEGTFHERMSETMGSVWPIIGAGVFLVIVGMLFRRANQCTRLARFVAQTPLNRIADLVTDVEFAAVQGSVVALEESLEAPLSGKPCVAFRVNILYYDGEGVDGITHQNSVAFAVDDGTGLCEIDREAWVVHDFPATEFRLADAPHKVDRARTHYGDLEERVDHFVSHATTCSESIIEEGATIYVRGPVSVSNGSRRFKGRKGNPTILANGTKQDVLEKLGVRATTY